MGMIKENANELKQKIENRHTFEPINLKCNGGFPYNAGVLNFEDSGDNQTGIWMFSNGQIGGKFEADEEFVLMVIGSNFQNIKDYFRG